MRAPQVPTIPGVTDFRSLLEFVRNGEAYDAALKALEAHQAECLRLIGVVADANDIDRSRVAASTDRNMAAEELRNAKAEAQALRATVAQERTDQERSLAQQAAAVEEARRAWQEEETTRQTALHARESAVTAHTQEAQALHADALRIRAEGQALKAEYEARLAKLKQLSKDAGL